MAVDPSQLAPPMPGGAPVPPAMPMPPDPSQMGGPPAMPADPLTDPNQVLAVLQAMKAQGMAQHDQEQNAGIAQGVAMMMQQMPNQAGMDATTGPGTPVPPPMPGGSPGDPMAGSGSGY